MKLAPTSWSGRFALGVALWLIPVAFVWALLTPSYNLFLTTSAENLVRLFERPRATRLLQHDEHHFIVTRTDVPAARSRFGSVRITDVHFPLVMLGAFFLAVPGIPWRKRLENLGWAGLISICFHIVSLLFWVQFIYATQNQAWSAEHYAPWQMNFWGLGKHLLDLPFKFAMPLLLWAAFYLRELLPASARD
jgi:hypothetical protein